MSLTPMAIPPVPAETARVARAAFPKGNLYMKLRERVGTIIRDEDFAALFAKDGAPGLPPWRLALVTILQFGPAGASMQKHTVLKRIRDKAAENLRNFILRKEKKRRS